MQLADVKSGGRGYLGCMHSLFIAYSKAISYFVLISSDVIGFSFMQSKHVQQMLFHPVTDGSVFFPISRVLGCVVTEEIRTSGVSFFSPIFHACPLLFGFRLFCQETARDASYFHALINANPNENEAWTGKVSCLHLQKWSSKELPYSNPCLYLQSVVDKWKDRRGHPVH